MTKTKIPAGRLYDDSPIVFTLADELKLLKSYRKLMKSSNPPTITKESTIRRLKNSLEPKYSYTQLSNKLRILRDKYRAMARHKSRARWSVRDRELFKVSSKIWGPNLSDDGNTTEVDSADGVMGMGNMEEEEEEDCREEMQDGDDGLSNVEVGDKERERQGIEDLGVLKNASVSEGVEMSGNADALSNGVTTGRKELMGLSVLGMDGMEGIDGLSNKEVGGRDGEEINGQGVSGNVSVAEGKGCGGMREINDNEDGLGARNGNVRREVDVNKYPFLLKEFSRCLPENPVWREGFKEMSQEKLRIWNDKWKKLQIEEARIMAHRADMLQEQMKELLNMFSSTSV